jgi:2-oxoglutarate ferredoxin oxidoreductase subunit delta
MARKDYQKIEYQKPGVIWQTFPEICKSCGLCIVKCPAKCLSYDLEQNEYLGMPAVKNDIEKCIACGTCERVCPDCAINLDKKK